MGIPDEKLEVYAEILQILCYRSGQTNVITVDQLIGNYLCVKERSFIIECIDDLALGEYPVKYSNREKVIEVTDKEKGERMVREIRSEVYDMD